MSTSLASIKRFFVGRGKQIEATIEEATQGAVPAGKDISNSRWSVLFRAYQSGADSSYLKSVTLTKQTTTSTAGDGGVAAGYIPAFTAAYPEIICEVVLKDANTSDAGTPSGSAEYHLEGSPWRAEVVDTAT